MRSSLAAGSSSDREPLFLQRKVQSHPGVEANQVGVDALDREPSARLARTRYLQENRKMRCEEAYEGRTGVRLTQSEVAGAVRAQFSPSR